MHVALDRGQHDLAARGDIAGLRLFRFHVRQQVRHCFLHDPRALHHLREEHLSGAEEVADDVHAVHQRSFDDGQRARIFRARLLDVFVDVIDDAFDQGVGEALFDRGVPPGLFDDSRSGCRYTLDRIGVAEQPLGGVGAAVEQHVLDQLEQVLRDLLVNRELPGIDDAHGQPRADGVVEKRRVHRLAHGFVAAEGERDVADAAGETDQRELRAQLPHRLDESHAVRVVLFDAGGHGEHVRIEDDVGRIEAGVVDQDVVRARADGDLALDAVRLPLLVEGHHDHRGAVAPDERGLLAELLLAFLERDRVDDRFPLQALQPSLEHRPLRAVDHDRNPGDVGLGADEVEEVRHDLLGVEEAFVHVDVEDVRAAVDLLLGDGEGAFEVARFHELRELRRAGDVGALADHDEVRVGTDGERLEAGEAQPFLRRGPHARLQIPHGLGDGPDVIGRRPAAAADDVEPAILGELAQQLGHRLRRLVVRAEGVGEAGVRIAGGVERRDGGELLDVRPHLRGAERAVDADAERRRVRDGVPEGLDGLPAERAPRGVGDGHGEHHREAEVVIGEVLLDGEDRGLEVQRVERRLREEDVDAAVDEAAHLLVIGIDELVEAHAAERRVVDVGRERGGAVGRPHRAGDEARALLRRDGVGGAAGDLRGFEVDVVDGALEAVVAHRDRLGVEGVGLDDVGARLEVLAVDLFDDARPREAEEVVGALEVARVRREALAAVRRLVQLVALDHGAHLPVEDEDASAEEVVKLGGAVGLRHECLQKTKRPAKFAGPLESYCVPAL